MVLLNCALVGDGSVISVIIEEWKTVALLKDAIKTMSDGKIGAPAPDLQLFLAKVPKEKVGNVTEEVKEEVQEKMTWLSSRSEDVKTLKKGGKTALLEALTKEDQELQAEDPLEDVLSGIDSPSARQIHVLVVIPLQDDLRSPAMTLLEVIVPHVLTNAPTTLTDRNRGFKDKLCDFYGCYSRKKSCVRCMLLDVAFPNSLVIASHLFRRSNEYMSLVMMQISDIDDVRNGLLLFKPLEHAFDQFQISFIRDDTDTFCLKLFDPSIRDTPLIDLKDRNDNKVLSTEQTELLLRRVSSRKKPCRFNVQTTFGDVDGRALTFTGLERPYYRCLNLQARVARMIALKKGDIDASYDFEDFWSEFSLDDKMEMFHRSLMQSFDFIQTPLPYVL